MQILKKAILAILILTIMIGVTGCMKTENKQDEMMSYMTNKYHEQFTFVAIDTQTWSSGFTEMIVHSAAFPDGRIVVRRNKDTGAMEDNYVDFLMKDKIEKEITSIAQPIYGNCKVMYKPGGDTMSDSINQNMTVAEYAKANTLSMQLTLCVYDSNYQANKGLKIEKLRAELADKQYDCILYIFYMLNSQKIAQINDANRQELLDPSTASKWASYTGTFFMDEKYKFSSSEWSEIK
jgi:protein involved in sex pheromone biosynthesis